MPKMHVSQVLSFLNAFLEAPPTDSTCISLARTESLDVPNSKELWRIILVFQPL